MEEVFGSAVGWFAEYDQVPGPEEGEGGGGDGSHTALEDRRGLGSVPKSKAVLEDLQARIVQTGIDETGLVLGVGLGEAVGTCEEGLPLFGALENEGGGGEDRCFHGAFRPVRTVSVAHHQAFGSQHSVTDLLLILLVPHGHPPPRNQAPSRREKRWKLGAVGLGCQKR